MEQGILFSKGQDPIREGHKSFCFAKVDHDVYWDQEDGEEVSHQEALYYDAIDRVILSRYI